MAVKYDFLKILQRYGNILHVSQKEIESQSFKQLYDLFIIFNYLVLIISKEINNTMIGNNICQ